MVNTDDGFETETSMIDFDETWSYDKPKNLNNKINKEVKKISSNLAGPIFVPYT